MEWISVKDRLPDENTDCIVYMQKRGTVSVCKFFKQFSLISMPGFGEPPITHWMKLPNPPKA